MGQTETIYRIRRSLPQYMQYPLEDAATGKIILYADIYGDNGVAPTIIAASASIDIIRPDGSFLADDQTAGISGNRLSYTQMVTAADEQLSTGYQIRWRCSIGIAPDGEAVVHEFIQRAFFVRHVLHPVLTNDDLLMRHPELADLYPPGENSWDKAIDTAWEQIQRRIIGKGKFPWLVLDPDALYEPHILLTLSVVFRTLSTYATGTGKYSDLFKQYADEARAAYDDLQLVYDYGDDGLGDDSTATTPAEPVVFLSDSPTWGGNY